MRPAAHLWALPILLTPLLAAPAAAATAYVSDELVLGVYAEQNGQGQRLATLHSGASVETLTAVGEFTQVRLNDGTTGWVKSTYLVTREPATVRAKELEEELDRARATTPALAEAAARSEVERLRRDLAAKQSELDAARAAVRAAGAAQPDVPRGAAPEVAARAAGGPAGAGGAPASDAAPLLAAARVDSPGAAAAAPAGAAAGISVGLGMAVLAALIALAVGFWAGYAALARRVRQKFGGIKVY